MKIVDMEDILKVNRLEGYTSPVRSVTWHPSGNLLVSGSIFGCYVPLNIVLLDNM